MIPTIAALNGALAKYSSSAAASGDGCAFTRASARSASKFCQMAAVSRSNIAIHLPRTVRPRHADHQLVHAPVERSVGRRDRLLVAFPATGRLRCMLGHGFSGTANGHVMQTPPREARSPM